MASRPDSSESDSSQTSPPNWKTISKRTGLAERKIILYFQRPLMGHSEQGWASEGSLLLHFHEFETYKEGDIWMLSSIEKRGSEKVGLM